MAFEVTTAMWQREFKNLRNGQVRQAALESKLLADNPDCVICPTCNGMPSSMGGRGYGLRAQSFCFTCSTGVIDFETWKQLGEERRAARKAATAPDTGETREQEAEG